MVSNHYSEDRIYRDDLIKSIGLGKPFELFAVDRGHCNGSEIHMITTTGLIIVYNRNTLKMVTVLIARPGQIERYYTDLGRIAPKEIVDIAFEHQKKGYNNM